MGLKYDTNPASSEPKKSRNHGFHGWARIDRERTGASRVMNAGIMVSSLLGNSSSFIQKIPLGFRLFGSFYPC